MRGCRATQTLLLPVGAVAYGGAVHGRADARLPPERPSVCAVARRGSCARQGGMEDAVGMWDSPRKGIVASTGPRGAGVTRDDGDAPGADPAARVQGGHRAHQALPDQQRGRQHQHAPPERSTRVVRAWAAENPERAQPVRVRNTGMHCSSPARTRSSRRRTTPPTKPPQSTSTARASRHASCASSRVLR